MRFQPKCRACPQIFLVAFAPRLPYFSAEHIYLKFTLHMVVILTILSYRFTNALAEGGGSGGKIPKGPDCLHCATVQMVRGKP